MPDVMEKETRTEDAKAAVVRRPKAKGWVIVLGILLVLVTGGGWAYSHYRNRVSTDDSQVEAHITLIAPRVPGNVLAVLVNDNQEVKAGDILVRLDPRDYEVKVAQAKAAVVLAQSQFRAAQTVVPLTSETTQSGASSASAQLADAMANLEQARIEAEQAASSGVAESEANVRSKQASNARAQADLARMKPLLDKAEISQQQYDSYVAAAQVAESELRAAEQQLISARQNAEMKRAAVNSASSRVAAAQAGVESSQANRKQVDVRRAEAGSSSSQVEVAQANLAAAELQLSYTNIVAPLEGRVTRKTVETGQTVAAGQSLMTLIPLHDVWVTANFKETQLASVHPGQRAEIDVDMYGDRVDGHVDSIASATGSKLSMLPPENATGNFVKVVQRIPVKILVDNPHGLILRPGMNVNVTIFTDK
ncbi:MAG TPA: HlyD family secretion protein [Candidatus Acidoferrum sp.]|nr:HlyD family secretion protein [Candidatus Acidoferrum sp.]